MQALNDFNRVYIYNKTLCLICSFLLIFIPAKKTFCISLFLLTCLPPQVHHALSKKIRSCLLWFVVKIFCNSHHWTYHGLYLVSSLLLSKSWRAVGTHCLHFLSFHSFLSILQFNFSSQQAGEAHLLKLDDDLHSAKTSIFIIFGYFNILNSVENHYFLTFSIHLP